MTCVQTCSGVFLLFLNKPKKPLFPFSLCFFSLTEDLCSSSPPGQTQKSLLEQTLFCGQTSAVRKLLVQYINNCFVTKYGHLEFGTYMN